MMGRDAPHGQHGQSTSELAVLSFLELTSPSHPASRLPRMLEQLLPRPLASVEELRRFTGDDVATMTPGACAHESLQLRMAAALVALDDVPPWIPHRLLALDARMAVA